MSIPWPPRIEGFEASSPWSWLLILVLLVAGSWCLYVGVMGIVAGPKVETVFGPVVFGSKSRGGVLFAASFIACIGLQVLAGVVLIMVYGMRWR